MVVDLLQPAFHGLRSDGSPDWPPSPLRLAQALMAGCHGAGRDEDAVAALTALVSLPAPRIHTGRDVCGGVPATYTSKTGSPPGSRHASRANLNGWVDLSMVGLTTNNRTAKAQDAVYLSDPRIVFSVDDPQSSVDVVALDRAARRVPYLGRSQDMCDMSVVTTEPIYPEVTWQVKGSAGEGPASRGWSSQSVAWMDLKHELTVSGATVPVPSPIPAYAPAWRYVARNSPTQVAGVGGDDLVVVPFPRRCSGQRAMATAGAVRRMIAASWPEVSVFPCVNAGSQHSDGSGHGLAFFVDTPLVGSSAAVEAAVSARAGSPALFADPGAPTSARAVKTARWRQSSRRWVSATPVRSFPDIRVLSYHLPRWVGAYGADVESWSVSSSPVERWQHRCRQPGDGNDLWWLSMTLSHEVAGPLLVGASRDSGFGLFVPEENKR
ncbi:hypothetical protein KEM60_02041 [Austwickia sp. TVS 96-490-7B]|nr:hypothetical protein [Austwickia sp. TVS 96-490-7B]